MLIKNWNTKTIEINKTIAALPTTEEKSSYLLWSNETNLNINIDEQERTIQVLPNHYIYCDKKTERYVNLEFGSIHSVKGRTHLATLVLETYSKAHNMQAILKYLSNKPPKSMGSNQNRLKCQYVAMTRAKALLCLAIPVEFVDEKAQKSLRDIGWSLKFVN